MIHSAGIVRGRFELTDEGIESNFAINYLSRFALTLSLLTRLEAAGKPGQAARIVIVGGAGQNGSIYFEDVNLTTNFATLRAVLQFCQANDLFTIELARRLAADRPVTITCLKIGVVKTKIRRDFPRWMKIVVPMLDPFLAQTTEEAAEAALQLLLAKEFEGVTGARFLKIMKFKQLNSPVSKDPAESERLWKLSERLVAKAQDRSARFLETKQN